MQWACVYVLMCMYNTVGMPWEGNKGITPSPKNTHVSPKKYAFAYSARNQGNKGEDIRVFHLTLTVSINKSLVSSVTFSEVIELERTELKDYIFPTLIPSKAHGHLIPLGITLFFLHVQKPVWRYVLVLLGTDDFTTAFFATRWMKPVVKVMMWHIHVHSCLLLMTVSKLCQMSYEMHV